MAKDYIDNPTDSDGDGIVQEDTPFERPATTPAGFIVAEDGDNYQTIAERLGGKHTAEKLHETNLGRVIYPGALVRIK
jgi:hypothetical protein